MQLSKTKKANCSSHVVFSLAATRFANDTNTGVVNMDSFHSSVDAAHIAYGEQHYSLFDLSNISPHLIHINPNIWRYYMMIRLKQLRTVSRIKQKEMGEILGITAATYNRYERGILSPSIDKLIILADFYNVSIDYLLMRTEDCSASGSEHDQNTLTCKYNLLDRRGRRAVDAILENEYQATIQQLHERLDSKLTNGNNANW